jgi:hypothetical protein
MKAKTLVILEQAIHEGVTRGYRRAHKHIENPTEGANDLRPYCSNV